MNEHMMMVIDHQMNPGKYTKKQLRQNAISAADAYNVDYANNYYDADASCAAARAAANAAYDAAAYIANCWIVQYFKYSSENKQDYVDEINRRSK